MNYGLAILENLHIPTGQDNSSSYKVEKANFRTG